MLHTSTRVNPIGEKYRVGSPMGLFSRSNSTATRRRGILQSASSSRGTSPGPDQPRSSRTSHDEDGRKFYQKGWLGSRTNSGASTPRLLPSRSGSRQDILITPIPEDVATDCSTADDRVPSAAASRDDAPSRQLLKRGRTPSKLSLSSALSDSTVQSSGSGNGRRKSLSRNGSSGEFVVCKTRPTTPTFSTVWASLLTRDTPIQRLRPQASPAQPAFAT